VSIHPDPGELAPAAQAAPQSHREDAAPAALQLEVESRYRGVRERLEGGDDRASLD
jgi:hypothetical protein